MKTRLATKRIELVYRRGGIRGAIICHIRILDRTDRYRRSSRRSGVIPGALIRRPRSTSLSPGRSLASTSREHPLYRYLTLRQTRCAEIITFIQVYQGTQLKASGCITGRELGQTITVKAMTEEILLEQVITPHIRACLGRLGPRRRAATFSTAGRASGQGTARLSYMVDNSTST